MYAKTLIPGPYAIPALMVTTPHAVTLLPQLTEHGWVRCHHRLRSIAAGQVRIDPHRLRVIVDDQTLLDDLNPTSPPGWWSAVDLLEDRCLVAVVSDDDVDPKQKHRAGEQLTCLIRANRALLAALPIVTELTG